MSRIGKIILWTLGLILFLFLGLHLLITFRSKQLVSRVVNTLSHGKYVAATRSVGFSYFPAGIHIEGLDIQPSRDTGKVFKLQCEKVDFELISLAALLFNKRMGVRLLRVESPDIFIKGEGNKDQGKKPLPASLSDIQKGMFNTFSSLNVRDALIQNGSLKVQMGDQEDQYFFVNHISLDLKKIKLAPDADNDSIPEFEGDVVVGLQHPDIHFANPALQVQLGHLEASSVKHALTIDSMRFQYAKSEEQVDTVNLSRITINQLNWSRFLKEGAMELDSVKIATGSTALNFYNPEKQKAKKGSAKGPPKVYMGPSFLVHYLNISNISYTLVAQEWSRARQDEMTIKFEGDSLWLKNLAITSGKYPAVDVEALRINFTNYIDKNKLNTYQTTLGALEVSDNSLKLYRYKLQAMPGGELSANNRVYLPELQLKGYSFDDLLLRRLIADKLIVNNPEIVVDILQKKNKPAQQKKDLNVRIDQAVERINQKVALREIEVNNASIRLQPKKTPNDDIVISGLSLLIDGKKALVAASFVDVMQSIREFSTKGFRVTGQDLDLQVSDLKLLTTERGLYFGRVQGRFGNNARVDLHGVTVLNRNNTFDITRENGLHASDILVDGGTVEIMTPGEPKGGTAAKAAPPSILADFIQFNNIVFKLKQDGKVGAGAALNLLATDFKFQNGIASWDKLAVNGSASEVISPKAVFSTGQISIEQPGTIALSHVTGNLQLPHAQIDFKTPRLAIGLGLSSSSIPEIKVERIHLKQPDINIRIAGKEKGASPAAKTPGKTNRPIFLNQLILEDGNIHFAIDGASEKQQVDAKTIHGTLLLQDLAVTYPQQLPLIQAKRLSFGTSDLHVSFAENHLRPAHLQLSMHDLKFDASAKTWATYIDSMWLSGIAHTFFGKKMDTVQVEIGELGIANMPFTKGDSLNWKEMLGSKNWWVRNAEVRYKTPMHDIGVNGLKLDHSQFLSFAYDSMFMSHRESRDSFWQKQPFEKDFISLSTGATKCDYFKLNFIDEFPHFDFRSLSIRHLFLKPERDKRRPDDTVSYRPLLAKQIAAIPLRISIDTLHLRDGMVEYHEIAEKSQQEGMLAFHNLAGIVTNVKTYGLSQSDSLGISVQASLYGKAPLQLRFMQSYTDTLQQFGLNVNLGRLDMTHMNTLLSPLMGIRIRSGIIDSMRLQANGNKYFAFGTINMPYRKMDVSLMTKEGKEPSGWNNFVNWLVNKMLRNKSSGGSRMIYKERVVGKGQFNFWGKIAVEGLLTSLGIKRSKKEKAKFEKAKKEYNFPDDYWKDLYPSSKRNSKK